MEKTVQKAKCLPNESDYTKICVFTLSLPAKDSPRVIYAAEYPPTASDAANMHASIF